MTKSYAASWFPFAGRRTDARRRLFCFPFAGGSAASYYKWQEELPAGVELYPVQLPGRGARLAEIPFTEMRPLVEALGEAMQHHLEIPFAFFGHSMGAIIAFELSRWLRRRHALEPMHLFVSGHVAPEVETARVCSYDLPEPAFMEKLWRLNGTPGEVLNNAELMQLLLPVLRADFAVIETYSYEDAPPLACRITALGGLEDKGVGRVELDAWREQTTGAFNLRMMPGDHFFLNAARVQILQIISREMFQFADTCG